MSSSLCSSSANECTSCIGTTFPNPTLEELGPDSIDHGAILVSLLSKSIEFKLPLSELDISPGSSPQLENIQAETSTVPDETYQVFTYLVANADSHHLKLQNIMLKAKNNETILPSVFEELRDSMDDDGSVIINNHRVCIAKKIDFIDKALDTLDLRIRDAFEKSEKTQRRLGQLNVVKDNIVPAISGINPMLAPAESAGKVAVGIMAYSISCEFDNQLKELGILDKSLRDNVLIALQTRSTLKGYMDNNTSAKTHWSTGCKAIYQKGKVGVNVTVDFVEMALERMVKFSSSIKQYLVLINQYYGPGITVVREARSFCDTVPRLYQYINMIGSARIIIRRSHKYKYEKTVTELGLAIYEYLELMKVVFNQKPIDPGMIEQFVNARTVKFIGDTKISIHQLENVLDKHTSSRHIKDAENKRMAGDRCYNSSEWKNRPPVNPEGVRAHLRKVDAAIHTIHGMSMASLGKISRKVDGQVERAPVKLTVTNPTLDGVHQTLNENVDKGLTRWREYQMEEKPPSLFHQMIGGMRSNHKAC